jgi:hypothetical protein
MSSAFRQFLARLAIDPEAYGQYLADPTGTARKSGLSETEQELLKAGDQNQMYTALTTDLASAGESE